MQVCVSWNGEEFETGVEVDTECLGELMLWQETKKKKKRKKKKKFINYIFPVCVCFYCQRWGAAKLLAEAM